MFSEKTQRHGCVGFFISHNLEEPRSAVRVVSYLLAHSQLQNLCPSFFAVLAVNI